MHVFIIILWQTDTLSWNQYCLATTLWAAKT